ncbi:MAG: hypothetical protein AAB609_01330 [Patescibacteria group bacterium]
MNEQISPPLIPPKTEASIQPNEQKQNKLKAVALIEVGLLEVAFVIVGLLVIFGIFNYFNLLPISGSFPFLSFLPRQQKIITNTINSSSNIPISATQSATSQTDSICKTITDQLFSAIKSKNVDSIYALESSEGGFKLDKNMISDILNGKDLRDIVSQTLKSSADVSKDQNRYDPKSTKKYYDCGGLTKYSSVPTDGFFMIKLINSDNNWKIFQYTYVRNTIQEYGNIIQDLQGIKKQTGMRLSQPTYLPSGHPYVGTVLMDSPEEADGKVHKLVESIFTPHPEQMGLGGAPQEVQIIQILGYKPTKQDILNSVSTPGSNAQPQEIDLNGNTGIYTPYRLDFVKNDTLIIISTSDSSVTKDELIKIAQSFTEVQ